MEDQLIDDLAIALTMGQIEDSLKLYKKCSATLSQSEFLEKILNPAINKIKIDFKNGKINNATYHVAENTSISLAKIVSDM